MNPTPPQSEREKYDERALDYERCYVCKEKKPVSEFKLNNTRPRGIEKRCRPCDNALCREYYRKNRLKCVLTRKAYHQTERGMIVARIASKQAYARSSLKNKARYLVRQTKVSGKLVQPDKCEECNKKAAYVQAHHDDYSKPLDVRWLCTWCHMAAHGRLAGPPINEYPVDALTPKTTKEES